MEKKKKKIWLIGGLVLCLVTVIGITFAFFSTGGTQDTANTFTSGCLNIELTDASSSINLTNTYPISDVEGVDSTSYDFTIRNTCDTPTNYSINLESLNQSSNSLNADYIKVSLSSNTVDNVISKLSDNTSTTPEIDGAYEAYTLYTGNLGAHEEKTYHLKLWIDYDATVEQAANKTYSSKINVIANPKTQVVDTLEATFTLDDKTLTSSLSNNVTSATYCTTTTNICEPTTTVAITNNSYTVELEENENNQMVCTKLNGTSKVICSNGLEIKKATLVDIIEELYPDKQDMLAYDNYENLRYIGTNPDNYVLFNNELWRIIGIFNEDTHGLSGQKLIKLIRNESIGSFFWDNKTSGVGSSISDDGSNDWSDSALQILLNSGAYWNKTSGACPNGFIGDSNICDFSANGLTMEAKEMIETVTWKLGGSIYNGVTASMFYERERGTNVYSGRPTEWTGKVGLMYPSDYGYATIGNTTTNRETCLATALYDWLEFSNGCPINDWLLFNHEDQWLLTPGLSSDDIMSIAGYGAGGRLVSNIAYADEDPYAKRDAHPVVYLKQNITITSGTGSMSDPFILSN